MSSTMEFAMAQISDEAYEELQQILEKQYGQAFAIEEVKEIGDGMINFYQMLATMAKEATRKEGQD